MGSYLYELPTTGAVSFSDFLIDSSASYIAEVADATETRANLRAALKESKRSDEKDHLRLVKVCTALSPTFSFPCCYCSKTLTSLHLHM